MRIVKWMFDWDMFEYKKLFIFKWAASIFKQHLVRKYNKELNFIKIIEL
jgi:hypothetical protein